MKNASTSFEGISSSATVCISADERDDVCPFAIRHGRLEPTHEPLVLVKVVTNALRGQKERDDNLDGNRSRIELGKRLVELVVLLHRTKPLDQSDGDVGCGLRVFAASERADSPNPRAPKSSRGQPNSITLERNELSLESFESNRIPCGGKRLQHAVPVWRRQQVEEASL